MNERIEKKLIAPAESEYRAQVRGAATYILLGQATPPIDALEVARVFDRDLAAVNADIDAIVQSEKHKAGGVFEVKTSSV